MLYKDTHSLDSFAHVRRKIWIRKHFIEELDVAHKNLRGIRSLNRFNKFGIVKYHFLFRSIHLLLCNKCLFVAETDTVEKHLHLLRGLAKNGQKFTFHRLKVYIRILHNPGYRIALKCQYIPPRGAVIIDAEHPFTIVHLEVFKIEPFMPPHHPTRVAKIVRTQFEMLHPLCLPAPNHGEIVILSRWNHSKAHVVRILDTLAARWIPITVIYICRNHHIRTDGRELSGDPVPKVHISVGHCAWQQGFHRPLVFSLRTVQCAALLATAEITSVVWTDVVVFWFSRINIVAYDLVDNRLIRNAEFHVALIAHRRRCAALSIRLQSQILGMRFDIFTVPTTKCMSEQNVLAYKHLLSEFPSADVFSVGDNLLFRTSQRHRRKITASVKKAFPLKISAAHHAAFERWTVAPRPVLRNVQSIRRGCDNVIVARHGPYYAENRLQKSIDRE